MNKLGKTNEISAQSTVTYIDNDVNDNDVACWPQALEMSWPDGVAALLAEISNRKAKTYYFDSIFSFGSAWFANFFPQQCCIMRRRIVIFWVHVLVGLGGLIKCCLKIS
jgi:hypothetical protein